MKTRPWLRAYSNAKLKKEMSYEQNMNDKPVAKLLRAEYARRVKSGAYRPRRSAPRQQSMGMFSMKPMRWKL